MLLVTEGLLIAVLGTHLVLLGFVVWWLRRASLYIKRARRLVIGAMDGDELIDKLMSVADPQDAGAGLAEGAPPAAAPEATPEGAKTRRTARCDRGGRPSRAVRTGGPRENIHRRSNRHSGYRNLLEKMYARYEARLGAAMTKTLGSAALQIYAGTVAMFLPIENQPGLIADLESDPFVGHALSSATCLLYHRYGMFLAPLTAALTTLKHCQFGHCWPIGVYNGGDEAGESRDGRGASTESSSGKSYGES